MSLPLPELARSLAAARVAAHARASGLYFSHFEHHVDLEGPDDWRPANRADLGQRSGWRAGVLREAKFRHFRLDRMVASYHPAHGPKWTAHELCHRLVGYAWQPGAPPLFVATAARLAELAPVALWYFYDEIGARRCERHTACDPRFDLRCVACEAIAETGPDGDLDPDHLREQGDRYVEGELAAIARSIRLGRPIPHRWATLELCSDGLAWAASHGKRLASRAFHAWHERFVPAGAGCHATLGALTERVEAVIAALRDGAPLEPWAVGAHGVDDAGRARRWIAQDVGWRIATIQADCEGEAADALDAIGVALADGLDVAAAIAGYRAVAEDFELPSPEDAFAVGYDLPGGLGRSTRQVSEGLATACPRTLALLGDAAPGVVARFVAADPVIRVPIGRRFAAHLAAHLADEADLARPSDRAEADLARPEAPDAAERHRDAAELAALEAAIVHAPPMDPAVATLREAPVPDGTVCRAPGVVVLRAERDWRGVLSSRAGRKVGRPPARELYLAVVREPDGEVALWEVDAAVAAVDDAPIEPDVAADVRAALLAAGVWAPAAWPIEATSA